MTRYLIPAVLVAGLLVFLLSAFTVSETEQVIVTQFGKPVGEPITEAGLHFRTPLLQTVKRFEKRILQWDGDTKQVVTIDKKYIYFDSMARWQIDNPLLFLRRVRDEFNAHGLLKGIIDGAVQDAVSSHKLIEVVRMTDRELVLDLSEEQEPQELMDISVGRDGLAALILEEAAPNARELGIELIDVRVKRINYVERVLEDVYERMITERNRIAARYRSEGEGERARILGQLEREMKTISSGAFREAEEIRGQADAEAARIYAEAYSRDPEFYAFLKTLETYEQALVGGDVTLVMSSSSELFRLLKDDSR